MFFVQAIDFIQGSVFILESLLLFTGGILASFKCFTFWEEYWHKCFSDSGKSIGTSVFRTLESVLLLGVMGAILLYVRQRVSIL